MKNNLSALRAALAALIAFFFLTQQAMAKEPFANNSAVIAVNNRVPDASAARTSKRASGQIKSAEMIDFGLYQVHRGAKVSAETVAGGLVTIYGKKLIESTEKIPAKIGTNFGFRYRLISPEKYVKVRIRVLHPAALRDPKTGTVFESSEWVETVPVGQVNWNSGWSFEYDWELVPGAWTIQLLSEGELLLERIFYVKAIK